MPTAETHWREAEFCVIDLETTGLKPPADEIISFAALHVVGGRLRLDDACSRVVRPRRMPSEQTIRIHGLREADLAEAPPLDAVLGDLLGALAGKALVAHVAWVEEGFLTAALGEHGVELRNPIVDTAVLAAALLRRRRQPPPDPLNLTTLAETFGLPVHRPHEADGDALTTAQLFLALATHWEAIEPQTVGSLGRMRRRDPPVRRLLGRVRDLLPI